MDSSSAEHHHQQEMGSETLESILVCTKSQQEKKLKPPSEHPQKCPRCDSSSTKFCYYNNYSLSQPRYFCKSCRRYWTKGGTLRNVPVGGGCRKNNKRSSSSSRKTQEQPLTINSNPLTFDSHHSPNDLNLAFAMLGNPNHNCDVLGNHSFGSFDHGFGFHNMYYGNVNGGFENGDHQMGLGYDQEVISNVKQEVINGGDRVLWGLPWQINGGDSNMVDHLGFGSANWHGLINSTLM